MIGGLVLLCFWQILSIEEKSIGFHEEIIPQNVWDIFIHNAPFSVIYAIPYVGLVYYVIGFFFVYGIIGVYIYSYGYVAAIGHLWHLPLEVFALSIPVYISMQYKKMRWQEIGCLIGVSIILLFVSSFIEFFMSRGV